MPIRSSTRAAAGSMPAKCRLYATAARSPRAGRARGARPRTAHARCAAAAAATGRAATPGSTRAHAIRGAQQRPRARRCGARSLASSRRLAATRAAADARLGEGAPKIQQAPVLHPARAGALAGAAAQAAIQVQLRTRRHRRALEQLLHEVDAPARAVQFVAQDLVRRAGGQTEATVHAAAQDRVGRGAPRAVFLMAGSSAVFMIRVHRR